MNSFEKEYYESERFWEGEAIQDENNLRRMKITTGLIPDDVHSLADIGCGNGVFVNQLIKERPTLDIMAIDRSETALKFVRTNKKNGDIIDIPLSDRSYDCVTCMEVIEHLPITVYQKALSELARVSKKYIIISVPYAEILEENHTQCPACKTIFNADLHLRSFSDDTMKGLMGAYGFNCIDIKKAGERIRYRGHYQFRKTFYPSQFRQWRSPICPICGFESIAQVHEQVEQQPVQEVVQRRSVISYFTALPKLFWPKDKKDFWVIGLFQRK